MHKNAFALFTHFDYYIWLLLYLFSVETFQDSWQNWISNFGHSLGPTSWGQRSMCPGKAFLRRMSKEKSFCLPFGSLMTILSDWIISHPIIGLFSAPKLWCFPTIDLRVCLQVHRLSSRRSDLQLITGGWTHLVSFSSRILCPSILRLPFD